MVEGASIVGSIMDVVFNPSNINEDALEQLVNSLSPNSSSDDSSKEVQNEEDNKIPQNYLNKTAKPKSNKRIQALTDSDSDDENVQKNVEPTSAAIDTKSGDSEENNTPVKSKSIKTKKYKSRIRKISSSGSDEDIGHKIEAKANNSYNLSRVKSKKEKLAAKFNKLLSNKHKYTSNKTSGDDQSSSEQSTGHDSENSDKELNSCNEIKQMFKEKEKIQISSICDPDTSEDEDIMKRNKKSNLKTTKLTSPKPTRISAKQAVENMQKIKSEANRMLREKDVSLPYHKPKALSLKDIMSRRKPALAPDGKTLSVKMTAEQLEQFALQLEQRQKEMMELCKSDDDDDEEYKENMQDQEINNHGETSSQASESTPIDDVNTNMIHLHADNLEEPSEYIQGEVNMKNVTDSKVTEAVEENFDINMEAECFTEPNKDGVIVSTNNEITTKVDDKTECKEDDSQIMELHYDSEKRDLCDLSESNANTDILSNSKPDNSTNPINDIDFPENDFNIDDIDEINDNIEYSDSGQNKSKQIVETHSLTEKPKLIGAPGMVIDLETGDTSTEKKLTGVELLKERFQYFAKLKSLEEQEKDREKKYKPGMQHLKLKQELEDQIAEQRSLEWAKRLENENQQSKCDETDNDDIEKLEAKLENLDESMVSKDESSESSEEEEEVEDDCIIEDKPRKRNPMLDDEAEESDVEEEDIKEDDNNLEKETETERNEDGNSTDEDIDSSSEESDDESSKSDDEKTAKQKKGRILKAFEDSDDENDAETRDETKNVDENNFSQNSSLKKDLNNSTSQDEELQLAQMLKTSSEGNCTQDTASDALSQRVDMPVKSQSFSIAHTHIDSTLNCLEKLVHDKSTHFGDNFSQDLYSQQGPNIITESQEIGDDIAAMCTGRFYDNPLVSQIDDNLQSEDRVNSSTDFSQTQESQDIEQAVSQNIPDNQKKEENQALSSILEELNDPDFDNPKQNKYFANENSNNNKENLLNIANNSAKKKFIIDSDDDTDETENVEKKIKKKKKKRKKEQKALQFSDDEEDEFEKPNEEVESAESDIDDDSQRIVEYDSEENEIVMELPKSKKKRMGDFFEQEAELTSEDEWVGSGDEDEHDLDRMEREEGDNDVFQEDKLRNELGQIHMRDVLDQDKREVRLLQELLFEDGDLGDGHRQRKFRWKNADDADEAGNALDEMAETQEEEFESEEQWRKQRHEREVFLRKMKGIDDDDTPNTSINRTSIIKANLCSRTMSSLLDDSTENIAKNPVAEKKTNKDIPSPKKPFPVFQQNYHGSLLSRGKGALARLAAIATPLATDNDDAPKAMAANNRGKFVFAALTPDEIEPKVSKRKAEAAPASPGNIKKIKTEEKQIHLKSSLFDYL